MKKNLNFPARITMKHILGVALVCSAAATPAWSLDLLEAYSAAMTEDASIRATRASTDARR